MSRNLAGPVLSLALTLSLACCAAPQPTPTPMPTPTPTLAPPAGVLAASAEDLKGVWLISSKARAMHLEFGADRYTCKTVSASDPGAPNYSGSYAVASGELRFEERNCMKANRDIVRCVGVYQAYVVMQAGKSVQLTLIAVDDQDVERAHYLDRAVMKRVGS